MFRLLSTPQQGMTLLELLITLLLSSMLMLVMSHLFMICLQSSLDQFAAQQYLQKNRFIQSQVVKLLNSAALQSLQPTLRVKNETKRSGWPLSQQLYFDTLAPWGKWRLYVQPERHHLMLENLDDQHTEPLVDDVYAMRLLPQQSKISCWQLQQQTICPPKSEHYLLSLLIPGERYQRNKQYKFRGMTYLNQSHQYLVELTLDVFVGAANFVQKK